MQTKSDYMRIAVSALFSAVFIFILSVSQISAEPYVYYHLDGDGTDAGSNGLDLVVNEDQLTWVEGIHGQAAFIKEGSNVNPLSMNEMYGSGDWTFEAWVKVESFPYYSFLFFMHAGQFSLGYGNMTYNSIEFCAFFSELATYPLSYSFTGRWFHFAGVYRDGQSMQLFINGEKVAEKVLSNNYDFSNQHSFYIGRPDWYPYTYEFTIDEIAIHNEALNPEDFIGMQYLVEHPEYTINGHITDSSSGEGLPGAVVTADPGEFSVATDGNGDFTIDLPKDGEYSITVNKSNYTSPSEQSVVVTADIPVTVNTALECFSSSSIVANFHFDDDGKDASGNGYKFDVTDGVTWTDGFQGRAAVLENIYVYSLDTSPNGLIYPGSGDITCEVMMEIHDPKGGFININISNHSYNIHVTGDKNRGITYTLSVGLNNYFYDKVELIVPVSDYFSEWIHVALVYRYKESLQLYLNGELLAEQETDFIPDMFPKEKFMIIASSGKFIIDELRISHSALNPEQFLFMETHVENSPSPSEFSITGNYPNPFNPSTTIEFALPETGHVNLGIYNITGQKIRELVSDTMTAGTHSVVWDGRDENGMIVPSGIYLSRLTSSGRVAAMKMLMVK